MKKHYFSILGLCLLTPYFSKATSALEGSWSTEDGSKLIQINEFNGTATWMTESYYSNGIAVNWFFQYTLPTGRDVKIGETIQGRVRSVDGYYNCAFDELAEAQLQSSGVLKVHFPLLSYHRETRSVRDGKDAYYYEHTLDWSGWGWVETSYGFPIERYRVISSECLIDQRNWITSVLTQTTSPFAVPLAPSQKSGE